MSHPAESRVQEIREQLRDLRKQQGLKLERVAADAQVAWLDEFEDGYQSNRSPTLFVAERVANALGKTLVLAYL